MQYRDKFRFLAKCLLGAGALAFLLAVFQPHHHQHVPGSRSNHSCVACKANENFGRAPVVSVDVFTFIPFATVCLSAPVEPVPFEVLLTSGPPRAPPHSA